MQIITEIYGWIVSHGVISSLAAYHLSSAFVGSLEMPDATSGKFYKFFFRFANTIAANYSRSSAAKTVLDAKTP